MNEGIKKLSDRQKLKASLSKLFYKILTIIIIVIIIISTDLRVSKPEV